MDEHIAHRAADMLNVLITAHVSDKQHEIDVHEAIAVRDDIRELAYELEGARPSHKFEVGEYALDSTEPTPSPEANTVKIVDVFDKRADEFVIEETGKTVAEHNPTFPNDDLVVAGTYPHMGDPDKVWHFPESRLRPV